MLVLRVLAISSTLAILAACSGGSGALMPQGGDTVVPMGTHGAVTPVTAQRSVAVVADDGRGDGDGGGGGSVFTLGSYINDLASDSALDLHLYTKTCDATLANAPTYTAASFTSLTLASISVADCSRSGVTGTTTDYIVLVDETNSDAVTAIAGPATEASNVLTFAPIVTTLTLNKTDSYAFMIATGTLSSGGSCHGDGDGDGHWGRDDGHHDHGCCHGNGDGDGHWGRDDDGHHHDCDPDHHHGSDDH